MVPIVSHPVLQRVPTLLVGVAGYSVSAPFLKTLDEKHDEFVFFFPVLSTSGK